MLFNTPDPLSLVYIYIYFLVYIYIYIFIYIFDIENSTSATGTETFCFTSLDDINKPYQADVGGYSFLLDREQTLQQGAAGDQHWREENQKTVARLSHLS